MNLQDIDIDGYDTLFIDRDGVINKHLLGDYVKCREDFEFLPGVFEAFAKWNKHFKHIIIVTNQRGIGKGVMSEDDLNDVHSMMISEIERHGGRVDKIYYCTALTDADPYRKPNTGMFLQAIKDFPDIKRETSLMVGDSESDMLFAMNCGIKGVMV